MKLTKWYPGNVKPVRDGVYQRDYGEGEIVFCLFKSRSWYWCSDTIKGAEAEITPSLNQQVPWRGIAK